MSNYGQNRLVSTNNGIECSPYNMFNKKCQTPTMPMREKTKNKPNNKKNTQKKKFEVQHSMLLSKEAMTTWASYFSWPWHTCHIQIFKKVCGCFPPESTLCRSWLCVEVLQKDIDGIYYPIPARIRDQEMTHCENFKDLFGSQGKKWSFPSSLVWLLVFSCLA